MFYPKRDEYRYSELRAAAMQATEPSDERLFDLAAWLDYYDSRSWNGECYDIDNGYRLYPIYEEIAEDEFEIVGYEIR